jgi:hypothetical protein
MNKVFSDVKKPAKFTKLTVGRETLYTTWLGDFVKPHHCPTQTINNLKAAEFAADAGSEWGRSLLGRGNSIGHTETCMVGAKSYSLRPIILFANMNVSRHILVVDTYVLVNNNIGRREYNLKIGVR